MLRTALTSFFFLTAAPAIAACTGPAFYDQLPTSQQVEITTAAAATPYGEILAIPACAFADITSGPPGLDKRLVSDAMDQGVPVARLEPWRTVIDIMTNWTIDEQIKLLEFGLFDAQDQTALHIGGLNHYFAGRTALAWEARRIALRNLSDMTDAEVDAELKETQDFILTQRNQNWIPVIEDAAKTHDDILIAFGAAHLPGDQGVLNLLAQAGWTVQRTE